ncbi:hypothetical protein [Simplicispira piscis]
MASADQILNTLQRARSGQPDGSTGAQDLDRQIANRQSALTIPETLAAPFSKPKAPTNARAVLSAVPSNPTDQRLAAGTQTTPLAAPATGQEPVSAASTPDSSGNVTRVGNSYSGGNISGDITVNGRAPGGGFMVADGRPQGLAAAAGIVPGSGVAGVQSPTVRHSGNDWQARNDLRNAMVSASSIMNDGGKWDKHGKGVVSPERAYAAQLAGADAQLRGAQPGVDVAVMRENAGIQRTGMQETGANQRSLVQRMLEQQKINQAGETQGIANRGASLIQGMREQVAAEQDPAKRKSLVQRLREAQGQTDQADPYLVVPGGQQVDENGKPYNMPSSVFNRQTQQFVQQPRQGGAAGATVSSPAQLAALPSGSVYVGPDGKQYRKN